MDVSRPYAAIVPSLDGDVLMVLAGTTAPLSGRQIAQRLPKGSERGVRLVLERLAEHGLVLVEQAGRAHMYTLNREHLAAPLVEALAQLRTNLFDRLRDEISKWRVVPIHSSVFGSTARGDGDVDSDIALIVVRPSTVDEEDDRWRSQIESLSTQVRSWTGNHLGVAEVAEEDVDQLRQERPVIVDSLLTDAVPLTGLPVHRLLRDSA
jgi:predicted nucleotidyltransferase